MIALWLLAGSLTGILNSLTRWWTVHQLRAEMPGHPVLLILSGMTLRFVLVSALLIAGLKDGIVQGLLAFGGLWLARWAAVLWSHKAGPPQAPALARRHCGRSLERERN